MKPGFHPASGQAARGGSFTLQALGWGLVLSLALSACSSAEPDPMLKQFNFQNAPNIVYLTTFGSQEDLTPPSAFMQWVLGRDVLNETIRPHKPYGIAISKGKVYINDGRRNAGYWIYDISKKELNIVRNNDLTGSTGIAVDERGYKYLVGPRLEEAKTLGTFKTDRETGSLVVFDNQDRLVRSIEFPGRPIHVAISGNRLFVTDMANHRIVAMNKQTLKVVKTFGKGGQGDTDFLFPKGIAAGKDGRIYVADSFNGRIKVFNEEGQLLSRYGYRSPFLGSFIMMSGIDVDRNGRVYVVDAGYFQKRARDEIQVFDAKNFYRRSEKVPEITAKREEKKEALLGYFQKPFAIGKTLDAGINSRTFYRPIDIAIDYENSGFYQHLMPPGFKIDYLIWLSSEFADRGRNISIFAFAVKK